MKSLSSYHHGALREALVTAAETILRRDGLAALTLRATAREAGVSHAAPAHHFEDLSGLLSDLAAVGFQRLATALREGAAASDRKGRAARHAYVAFARDNPALFLMMFRSERLNMTRPALYSAATAAFDIL